MSTLGWLWWLILTEVSTHLAKISCLYTVWALFAFHLFIGLPPLTFAIKLVLKIKTPEVFTDSKSRSYLESSRFLEIPYFH